MTTEKEEKEEVVIIRVSACHSLFMIGSINPKTRHFHDYGQGATKEEALDDFGKNIKLWFKKNRGDYVILDKTNKTMILDGGYYIVGIED